MSPGSSSVEDRKWTEVGAVRSGLDSYKARALGGWSTVPGGVDGPMRIPCQADWTGGGAWAVMLVIGYKHR